MDSKWKISRSSFHHRPYEWLRLWNWFLTDLNLTTKSYNTILSLLVLNTPTIHYIIAIILKMSIKRIWYCFYKKLCDTNAVTKTKLGQRFPHKLKCLPDTASGPLSICISTRDPSTTFKINLLVRFVSGIWILNRSSIRAPWSALSIILKMSTRSTGSRPKILGWW